MTVQTRKQDPVRYAEVNFFDGLEAEVPPDIVETLSKLRLVDHHVHGTFTAPISRAAFEESIHDDVRLPARLRHTEVGVPTTGAAA
jgi:hypothetical protein